MVSESIVLGLFKDVEMWYYLVECLYIWDKISLVIGCFSSWLDKGCCLDI